MNILKLLKCVIYGHKPITKEFNRKRQEKICKTCGSLISLKFNLKRL